MEVWWKRLGMTALVVLVFLGLSVLIIARAHTSLRVDAEEKLDAELSRYATLAIATFDRRVQTVVAEVADTQISEAPTCSPRMFGIARFLVGSLDHVQDIGVASSDGTMMCSVLRPDSPVRGFLAPWSLEDPEFSLAVLEGPNLDRRPLVLVINRGVNNRLIVRFAPTLIPETFSVGTVQSFIETALILTTGETWIQHKPIASLVSQPSAVARFVSGFGDHRSDFSATLQSTAFPIIVSIVADSRAVEAFYRELEPGMNRLIIWSLLIILSLLFVAAWRTQKPETDYRAVFDEGEFVPFYQPVVDLTTGDILGSEVLLRFKTNTGKLVQPAAFISYAETTGVIMDVTREIMSKVAAEMSGLSEECSDLKVSINLTGKHFEDMRVVDDIQAIFGPSKIEYSQLVFELTERDPVNNFEIARMVIAAIQELGCSVALDDAGTGHGGFSYLQKLGIDIIKIDKMFIDTFGHDATTRAIVDTIIDLAKSLDMGIVAEGVENEEQIGQLKSVGISAAQGFFFSPAISGKDYEKLVLASRSEQQQSAEDPFESDMDTAEEQNSDEQDVAAA